MKHQPAASAAPEVPHSARTLRLLQAPVLPLLLTLAWPNILIMLVQASTGLVETWWLAHLGTDALAGMALVFPAVMLMQMIAGGAMGGGISSAIARALGAGRREDANALVLHALLINGAIGLGFSALMLTCGAPVYRLLGGEGAALEAALRYSDVVFAGNIFIWLMNGLSSVIRGTGNMVVPGVVICAGAVLLVPLSPLLIFGFGPVPALGIVGGGAALILYYIAGTLLLGWYVLSGRNLARLHRARLRWPLFRDILRVGAVAAITSVMTNVTIALSTGLVGQAAGVEAVAGFGTGARLEYLLVPLVFGFGGPLVALVGTNIGAGQGARAMHIATVGAALTFAMTEAIGVAAALWPAAWLGLFSADPGMIETGSTYLRIVGPFYGFFGLGMAFYFGSQGAGRLFWPLVAGFLRVVIAIGGGWLALRVTGALGGLFAALATGLVAYGLVMTIAVRSGAWFQGRPL